MIIILVNTEELNVREEKTEKIPSQESQGYIPERGTQETGSNTDKKPF